MIPSANDFTGSLRDKSQPQPAVAGPGKTPSLETTPVQSPRTGIYNVIPSFGDIQRLWWDSLLANHEVDIERWPSSRGNGSRVRWV